MGICAVPGKLYSPNVTITLCSNIIIILVAASAFYNSDCSVGNVPTPLNIRSIIITIFGIYDLERTGSHWAVTSHIWEFVGKGLRGPSLGLGDSLVGELGA